MYPLTYGAGWLVWVLTLPGPLTPPGILPERIVAESPAQGGAPAPPASDTERPGREFFFSWGYNGNTYANSDLHIRQPALGNDFTLSAVRIRDGKGWTDLFNHSLFVPQYNVRAGFFFNQKWGVELALDHIKWIVRQDQTVRITGRLNGAPVDTQLTLEREVLRYQLNNGANPIFINLIRRVRVAGEPGRTGYVSLHAKAGGGFAVPHTENVLFGQPNEKGFQFGHGWNVDAGAAVRAHLWRRLYFEFEDKLVYARYFGVKVDRGTAGHSVKANQFVFNLGVTFW